MKYYKVMIDFKNYIPIDETELEKALGAWAVGGKALFNEGATNRVEVVLPDYVRMMGWNRGFEPQAEDWAEIESSKDCNDAKKLIGDIKLRISGGATERPKEISDAVKKLAESKRI